MKKIVMAALLVFMGMGNFAAAQEMDKESAYKNVHALQGDYVYRTDEIVSGQPAKKTIWDYLSFFALPKSEKDEHHVAAQEARELKLRIRELAAQLITNSAESVAEEYVVIVSSFVNLSNLYQVSSFGRYIGEQLIGELQLAGVEVVEVRKTPGLMIQEGQGEYSLSRDMAELSYIHSAHAIVVGTYTYSNGQVMVNARLLSNPDGIVLSQANLVFELDPLTREMLADESAPTRSSGNKLSVQAFKD